MEILSASDKEQVKRYSSINQFNTMLHVIEKGEAVPIVSDWLDEIDCNGHIKSHKVMINLKPWSGHYFPVNECSYKNTEYIVSDYQQTDFERDEDGELQEIVTDKKVAVSSDGPMFGLTQTKTLRVGTDYVWGDEMLEAVD